MQGIDGSKVLWLFAARCSQAEEKIRRDPTYRPTGVQRRDISLRTRWGATFTLPHHRGGSRVDTSMCHHRLSRHAGRVRVERNISGSSPPRCCDGQRNRPHKRLQTSHHPLSTWNERQPLTELSGKVEEDGWPEFDGEGILVSTYSRALPALRQGRRHCRARPTSTSTIGGSVRSEAYVIPPHSCLPFSYLFLHKAEHPHALSHRQSGNELCDGGCSSEEDTLNVDQHRLDVIESTFRKHSGSYCCKLVSTTLSRPPHLLVSPSVVLHQIIQLLFGQLMEALPLQF
mmetsp:Transcript_35535/g.92616  ORF Transcript_35535/g.92616 Transcript_35535/m.92616 type:complete len:286 (-) Transcript_35535:35-892(-)